LVGNWVGLITKHFDCVIELHLEGLNLSGEVVEVAADIAGAAWWQLRQILAATGRDGICSAANKELAMAQAQRIGSMAGRFMGPPRGRRERRARQLGGDRRRFF
jgi:hypothetical protein